MCFFPRPKFKYFSNPFGIKFISRQNFSSSCIIRRESLFLDCETCNTFFELFCDKNNDFYDESICISLLHNNNFLH